MTDYKFESLVPKLMDVKDWTPTMLDDKLRKADCKISWPIVFGMSNGDIPKTTATLLKLCVVFECQPNDLIMFVQESEQ